MQSCLKMLHGTSDKKCKRKKKQMFIGTHESHMENVFLIYAATTTLDQICPQTLTLIALLLSLLFHAIIIVVIVHRQHAAQCIQWIQGISPLLL